MAAGNLTGFTLQTRYFIDILLFLHDVLSSPIPKGQGLRFDDLTGFNLRARVLDLWLDMSFGTK